MIYIPSGHSVSVQFQSLIGNGGSFGAAYVCGTNEYCAPYQAPSDVPTPGYNNVAGQSAYDVFVYDNTDNQPDTSYEVAFKVQSGSSSATTTTSVFY